MADVFSSTSPCMLGKRVLSPHSHGSTSSGSTLIGGQLDFSSKKRRLGQEADQGKQTSKHVGARSTHAHAPLVDRKEGVGLNFSVTPNVSHRWLVPPCPGPVMCYLVARLPLLLLSAAALSFSYTYLQQAVPLGNSENENVGICGFFSLVFRQGVQRLFDGTLALFALLRSTTWYFVYMSIRSTPRIYCCIYIRVLLPSSTNYFVYDTTTYCCTYVRTRYNASSCCTKGGCTGEYRGKLF